MGWGCKGRAIKADPLLGEHGGGVRRVYLSAPLLFLEKAVPLFCCPPISITGYQRDPPPPCSLSYQLRSAMMAPAFPQSVQT